ncbi:RNA polymerase sigma factor RpoE [Lachnospiraceae bacterium KM106-2]|nr:RNA polymerase sigma factor RpoE [Lachnospiraceae bacterium KM106-2]
MQPQEELIQAIEEYKAGRQEAFFQICMYSDRYLYTCINNVVHNPDLVPDFMQETYIEVSRKLEQLEDIYCYYGWIGTIATRKCFAYLRKNNQEILLEEEDRTIEDTPDNVAFIPESIVQDKEKQRLLKNIIDEELTDMQRLCIVGYYYNNQKQEEIAQDLEIPLNTVKTNLSRAKAKIKKGVLSLEKEHNTRLYSLAPAMVLLLDSEVRNAVIPDFVASGIAQAITGEFHHQATVHAAQTAKAVTGATAKTVTKKAVSKAVKGKIAAAVVGAALIGGAGTVAVKQNPKILKPVQQMFVKEKKGSTAESSTLKKSIAATSIPTQTPKAVQNDTELLSKDEKTKLKVLLGCFFGGAKQGEGQDHVVYDVKREENIYGFMDILSQNEYQYEKLVPSKVKDDSESGYPEFYELAELNKYLNEIFGASITKTEGLDHFKTNKNKFEIYMGELSPEPNKCSIEKISKKDKDTIEISGRVVDYYSVDYAYIGYGDTYEYKAELKKNYQSMFGYTLVSLSRNITSRSLEKKTPDWMKAYLEYDWGLGKKEFDDYSIGFYDFDKDGIPEAIDRVHINPEYIDEEVDGDCYMVGVLKYTKDGMIGIHDADSDDENKEGYLSKTDQYCKYTTNEEEGYEEYQVYTLKEGRFVNDYEVQKSKNSDSNSYSYTRSDEKVRMKTITEEEFNQVANDFHEIKYYDILDMAAGMEQYIK